MAVELPPIIPPHPNTPEILAPRNARRMPTRPATHHADEPRGAEIVENVGGRLPDLFRRPVFGLLSKVNKVIFRSHKPGDPLPRTEGSWSFSALGDYGSGSHAQAKVAQEILKGKPDLVVTLGDNVYWKGTEKNFQKKWDPDEYFGNIRKSVPVMPALGNHDLDDKGGMDAYFRRFPELKGARYYSYQKDNVYFTALDSNESLAKGSPQHNWLQQSLSGAPEDAWKVVYFHHPMYSGYTARDGVLRDELGPTMAQLGVDLVLTGHDHSFERTKPLNEHGTVHAMVGAGGHTLYPYLFRQPDWSAYRTPEYGFLNVEVTDDRLVGRYTLKNGKVRDTFTLTRESDMAVVDAATGADLAKGSPLPPPPRESWPSNAWPAPAPDTRAT